jgi:purine-nucleoside phosphorylase
MTVARDPAGGSRATVAPPASSSHPVAAPESAADDVLHSLARITAAVAAIRARYTASPEVAIILGTGLGALGREIALETSLDYATIPGFPLSTVESHSGRLLFGAIGGKQVVAMQGRLHRYEGYTLQQVTFPVRVMRALGARTLIVSNACGVMNPLWNPGELMLIADHINLLGDNPLVGPNDDALGPRFPDMSQPYDPTMRGLARAVAVESKLILREGVYAAVSGPNLETRAEYRMLRNAGADVVGMSTVPEVIVAIHGGMRVLGVSILTDRCLPDALAPASVEEIIATASRAEPQLTTLVRGVLERL